MVDRPQAHNMKASQPGFAPQSPSHDEAKTSVSFTLKENVILLAAGGVAGLVSRTVTAPVDRIKVLFQAGNVPGRTQHTSIFQSAKDIYLEGGWRGFYRGNATNIIKVAPETAIKFWIYENLKLKFSDGNKDPSASLMIHHRFLAGAAAGMTAQFCIYPLEVTKTRLALANRNEYSGIADCIASLARKEGITALYKGLIPALSGIVPYAGVDLGVYSFLKDGYVSRNKQEPGPTALLACGVISSTCGQIVAYPLVVVRTRLQAQGMAGRPIVYTGMHNCFQQIIQKEGWRALYRGLLANFMKAIPAISISYVVYETIRKWMEEFEYGSAREQQT